ncbi:MAG: MerR family DNA-binding transcriptional regulator [Lachnospiraceae bacterium]
MKKINEVSRFVGVSKRTLQYYDNEDILLIERTSDNHRVYDYHKLEQIWKNSYQKGPRHTL